MYFLSHSRVLSTGFRSCKVIMGRPTPNPVAWAAGEKPWEVRSSVVQHAHMLHLHRLHSQCPHGRTTATMPTNTTGMHTLQLPNGASSDLSALSSSLFVRPAAGGLVAPGERGALVHLVVPHLRRLRRGQGPGRVGQVLAWSHNPFVPWKAGENGSYKVASELF